MSLATTAVLCRSRSASPRCLSAACRAFSTSLHSRSSYPADDQIQGKKRKKVTLNTIRKLYERNEPISVMTAHDYPSALFVDRAGVEVCLVGDSLAMVALGHDNTNQITLNEMIHHSAAVARGCKAPFIVGDLPFGSYECGVEQAIASAVRYIRDGKVEAVKLEGGVEMAETVRRLTGLGIPVMGHVGLTPQRQTALGGYRVQGKTVQGAKTLLEGAIALQEAGCFSIVLEAVPEPVATLVTSRLSVPTIGIGAGSGTSGQVLVFNDALGVFDKFLPKFCKVYASLGKASVEGLRAYHDEVKARKFPDNDAHGYKMDDEELARFEEWKDTLPKK
ncbi:ketopantoate hydroxymethyltransferase-domain-containing protein [Cladochytrium replicatum]|nr:ketopantoate hydroxymethyltransferase-domain-containing protein [Cladochytrium replicatum]